MAIFLSGDQMKLSQLFENAYPDYASRPVIKAIDKQRSAGRTQIGVGATAYVDTDDVDNFADVTRVADETDPGSLYLRWVSSNLNLKDNPFVPKVRAIKTEDGLQYTTSERLYPFDDKLFNNNNKMLLIHLWNKYFTIEWDSDDYIHYTDFVSAIEAGFHFEDISRFKDPQLKQFVTQVLKFMKDFDAKSQTHKAVADIHAGNLMWRTTQYGPQLVFVDPVHVQKV